MDINVIKINSSAELLPAASTKKIIDRKTFYIYKFHDTGIDLYIIDGIKTDPPIMPYHIDYAIPKGITHKYRHDYIDPNNLRWHNTYNIFISLKRNDKQAIKYYKKFLQGELNDWLDRRKQASHDYYVADKTVKQYKALIEHL